MFSNDPIEKSCVDHTSIPRAWNRSKWGSTQSLIVEKKYSNPTVVKKRSGSVTMDVVSMFTCSN